MDKNYELELYKVVNNQSDYLVDELGWINDKQFCVWVSYFYLYEFIQKITNIFGYDVFDDGGVDANMHSNCVCIDLCEMLCGYGIDFETVFPKERFKH